MNIAATLHRLEKLMQEWPAGAVVWHRARGKRGVIGGYCVTPEEQLVEVCFGANTRWEKCLPLELSASKVSDGTDGEEWKDGEETSAP